MKSRSLIFVLAFGLTLLSVLPHTIQGMGVKINEIDLQVYNSQRDLWGGEETGPWVDKIVVESIDDDLQMILSLIDGDIDACMEPVSSNYTNWLEDIEDIELTWMPRNAYGLLNINCEKYPLNITEFRRALAFAIDKENLCDEALRGLAQPHDSCVPAVNHLSNENQTNGLYYDTDLATANELLDIAGFVDIDSDGFREAPNGSNISISVYDFYQEENSHYVCLNVVNTLHSMSIKAGLVESPRDSHDGFGLSGDYDIAFDVQNFNSFSLDELFVEYLSINLENPYRNIPRFSNLTYDTITNYLLHSVNYEEVKAAALALQEIILYECPIIVCYEPLDVYAYRTDAFSYDCDYVAADFWRTCYKAYRKNGDVIGGTFTYGTINRLEIINLNETSKKLWDILSLSFDSLFRININGQLKSGIAYDCKFQNHSDDSTIPLGHCRCKVRIPKIWGWIDGTPLTALDVAQSLNYFREVDCGWLSKGLEDLTAIFSLNSVDLILEFNTESYWNFYNIVTKPIIPIHYFKEKGIGDLSNWDLDPRDVGDFPDCGAFILTTWVRNFFLEFEQNPDSPYNPRFLCGSGHWVLELPSDDCYSVISHPQHWVDEISAWRYGYSNIDYFAMEYELYINNTFIMGPHPTYWLDPIVPEQLLGYELFTIRIGNLSTGIYEITVKTTCLSHESSTTTVIIRVSTEEEVLMESSIFKISLFIVSFILTIAVGLIVLKGIEKFKPN